MATDPIVYKFKGNAKDSEVGKFVRHDAKGEAEPPKWSANVTAKLASRMIEGKGRGKLNGAMI